MNIHDTALVSPKAELGKNVSVGAFAIIEDGVTIGDECRIDAQAQVRKGTTLGEGCEVGSGAILGASPQFIGFDPETLSGIVIGKKNTFREYVTVHRSFQDGVNTIVGDENYFMTGSHIGHDCIIGNHNTTANNVLFAGHVEMGNHCFIGGSSAFHQFVRIGDHIMAQGMTGFSTDIPPFCITSGVNYIAGLNSIGMRRAGFDPATRLRIKKAFGLIYQKKMKVDEARAELSDEESDDALEKFFHFFETPGKKGICLRMKKT